MQTVNYVDNCDFLAPIKGVFYVSLAFLFSGIDFAGPSLFSSASAQDNEQSPEATIVIKSVSNSASTKGRTLKVTSYKDKQCARPGKTEKVFRKKYAKGRHTFKPLTVESDKPFIFQVSYLEERRNETRGCAAISSVVLKAGRQYNAIFNVVGEVVGCEIDVFDVTDNELDQNSESVPIADASPELTCAKVGKHGYKNGVSVYQYSERF